MCIILIYCYDELFVIIQLTVRYKLVYLFVLFVYHSYYICDVLTLFLFILYLKATVRPKCGHMVAFSAGEENLHGVKAVRKGRRCALAMWYTMDTNHRERERDFAESVLENIWSKKILTSHPTASESFEKATLLKFAHDAKHSHNAHSEL